MNVLFVILAFIVLFLLAMLVWLLKAHHAEREQTRVVLSQKNEAETRMLLSEQVAEGWQQRAAEESSKNQQLTQQLQELLAQISALKAEKNFLQE